MAQKRMLDKKISVSEQVANMQDLGKLIYTWAIPHADDVGLLPRSHRTLKALLIPMIDDKGTFEQHIQDILKQGLWEEFEQQGEKFYKINNFWKYQTLKKDRQPQTMLKIKFYKKPKDTWKHLEDIGFQLEDTGFQLVTEEKRREEKKREEKKSKITASINYLEAIPEEDLKEISKKYSVTEQCVKDRANRVINYCKSKGREYKNYKAALCNFVQGYLEQHPEARIKPRLEPPPLPSIEKTDEECQRNKEKLAEMRQKYSIGKSLSPAARTQTQEEAAALERRSKT